jgi:hypothetical protein
VVSLEVSALGLAPVILAQGPSPILIADLYHLVKKSFESIDQFLLSIDVLYVLGRVNIDFNARELTYVV